MARLLVFVFFLFIFCSLPSHGGASSRPQSILLNHAGAWPVAIAPQAEVFEDPSGALSFPDVLATASFRPVTPDDMVPRYTASTFWFRFTLTNVGDESLRLVILAGSPRNESVSLFWQAGAGYRLARAGARVPASAQVTASRFPLFPVVLAPSEPTVFYLRGQSSVPLRLDPQVYAEAAFLRAESRATFWSALLIGGFAAFSFCSLLIFAFSRVASFGWLAALGASIGTFEIAVRGYGQALFWPELHEWNYRSPVLLGCINTVLFVVFAVSIAKQEKFVLPGAAALKLLAVAMVGVGVLAIFGDLSHAARLTLYGSAVFTVAKLGVAIVLVRRFVPSAKLLVATALVAVVHIVGRFYEVPAVLGWQVHPRLGFDPDPLVALGSFAINLALLAAWVAHVGKQRGVARDALARWQSEEQARLSTEVQRQTAALNGALQYAEKKNEERAYLLGYVSHDLRAPLATVEGYLKQLKAWALPGQEAPLQAIERSLQYQHALIRDILDFSRGELAPLALSPAPLDLEELLKGIGEYGQAMCEDTGNRFLASIDVKLGKAVLADGVRLQQVLLNLLRNAATYTSDGTVHLVASAKAEGLRCRLDIAVRDNGPGVAPADRDRIFVPYQRGAQDREGAGLGLYIVQHIVASMGGKVSLSSTPAHGSEFRFVVMLPLDDTPVEQLMPATQPDYQRRTVQPASPDAPLPPPHLRMELAALAREGRVTDIEAWVNRVGAYQDLHVFVTAVANALEVLDLAAIERLALRDTARSTKPEEGRI